MAYQMATDTDRVMTHSDSSSSDDMVQQTTWTARRTGLTAVGVMCLIASGIAAVFAFHPGHRADSSMITARELLQSDEMIKAVAQNQMDILKLKDDEKKVQINVAKGIKKIEEEMQADKPAQWRELNELKLSPQHRDAVLRIISSFGDPRVQALGRKVARACADGRGEGHMGVARRLTEIFNKDELPKMRRLKNELFRGLHKQAQEGSDVTFDVESIRFLRAFSGDSERKRMPVQDRRLLSRRLALDDLVSSQKSDKSSDDTSVLDLGSMGNPAEMIGDSQTLEEALDFFGGIEEQTRVALDQIDFVGQSFGWDSKVPAVAKSGVGAADFVTNVADCVARADGNDVKEGMCPFKYGAAAFDAISCLDNMAGVSNARMGVDNPGGYDVWDEIFGTPAPGSAGAFTGVSPGPAPNDNPLSMIFDSPTPAPALAAANTNTAFTWQ